MKSIKLFIVTISSSNGEHSRIVRDEMEAKRHAFKHRRSSLKATIRPVVLSGEMLESIKPVKITAADAKTFKQERLEREAMELLEA